jgi:hypothetical protein
MVIKIVEDLEMRRFYGLKKTTKTVKIPDIRAEMSTSYLP